jgi:hypothetical protein
MLGREMMPAAEGEARLGGVASVVSARCSKYSGELVVKAHCSSRIHVDVFSSRNGMDPVASLKSADLRLAASSPNS